MDLISFTLPGQPIGKPKKFNRHSGVGYNDKETTQYMHALGIVAKVAMAGREPFDGPVKMEVWALYEIPSSWPKYKRADAVTGSVLPTCPPDYDNVCKTIGDALKGIVWRDDSVIVDVRFLKRYGVKPQLVINVEAVKGGG